MSTSQFQELQQMQKMQRLLQEQMQAQLRQQQQQPQQAGTRMSQQAQMMSGGSFGSLPQGMGQMQQPSQFSNQQWMDPNQQQLMVGTQPSSQRNSFTGLNSAQAAMMLQQQGSQNSMNMTGANSALYWNAMQGNQKTGSSGMDSTGSSSNLATLSGMNMGSGGSQQLSGLVDSQMQALMQRQSMGNKQSSQMLGMSSQQSLGGGKADLSNAMSMMNQQQQLHPMSQLQKMQGGSSSVFGRTDVQNQSNTGTSSAQLLLQQQQSVIAELKRRLHAQQNSNSGSYAGNNSGSLGASSSLLGTGMGDHRSSSYSIQQQAQLLDMQQRGSANSAMIQQAMANGMIQDPSMRGGTSSASLNSHQSGIGSSNQMLQRNSFSSAEPISIATLMGQNQNSMELGQMGNRGSNPSLLGIFDHATVNSNNTSSLLQQQTQLQQMANGGNMVGLGSMDSSSAVRSGSMNDQILGQQQMTNVSSMGSTGNDVQQAQQLLMGQSGQRNSMTVPSGNQGMPSSDIMTGFNDVSMRSFGGNSGGDLGGSNLGKLTTSVSGSSKKRRSSGSRAKKVLPDTSDQPSGSQSFLDGTFNGGWQSNDDIPDRRRVIYSICKVIEQMRPDASKMSERLPFMAKRLEEHLYRSAQTKDEYLDSSTLKARLQQIALGLDVHRSSSDGNNKDSSERDGDPPSANALADSTTGLTTGFNANANIDTVNQQQMLLREQVNQLKQMQQLQQQQQLAGSTGNSLEALLKHQQLKDDMLRQQNKLSSGQPNSGTVPSGMNTGGGQDMTVNTSDLMTMVQQQQDMMQFQSMSAQGSQNKTSQGILKTSSSKYDPQKRQVLKQQQQRLLLLRHASKCKEGSACKVKFCGQMILLWKHMKKCRDKDCKTAHCLSSRCVLNHYRLCKANNRTQSCEVCGPVMRQIKEHHPPAGEETGPQPKDITSAQAVLSQNFGSEQQALHGGKKNAISLGSVGSNSSVSHDVRQQLQEAQVVQQTINQKRSMLNQVQSQQMQLFEQQRQLEQQQHHVLPQTPKGQQLQQQQLLLQQLQQQFQQQEVLFQQEIMRLSQMQQGSLGVQNLQADESLSLQGPMSMTGSQNVFGNQPMLGKLDLQGILSHDQALTSEGLSLDSSLLDQSNAIAGKRRSSAPRRTPSSKSLERQHSSNSIGAKVIAIPDVRRGSLGKRLSALESISRTSEVDGNVGIGVADSFDTDGPSINKVGDQGTNFSSPLRIAHGANDGGGERHREEKRERVLSHGDSDCTISLLSSMSKTDIEEHLRSLERNDKSYPAAVTKKLLPVLRRLLQDQQSWVFHDPVDIELLRVYDYYDVVKNPMCLTQVEQKLESGVYQDMKSAESDVRLVFENAILYNGTDSVVGEMAVCMIQRFENELKSVGSGKDDIPGCLTDTGDTCKLCDAQRLLFEHRDLYCSGSCGMQKILRNSYYYTSRVKANPNHWCVNCYLLLKDDELIVLDDGAEVGKRDLEKVKNDAMPEEAWVRCDRCDSWMHQICALFNGRKNNSSAFYSCPKCHLMKLDSNNLVVEPLKTAKDLPHCKMSEAIEKGLERHLRKEYESRADDLGVSVADVAKADGLCVRVIANTQKTHRVRDEMYKRYSKSGCPCSFPVRSKCVALFQKIQGADVMLFAMYVFEYGHDCPAPNRGRVYISYLDSIKYLEPNCYRSGIYQCLVVEYLRYVKDRGFHTAHIWSCPPSPGDDYVFHLHPSTQLTPRDDMLRKWYHAVFEKAKAEGVVLQMRTIHDEYFKNNGAASTTGQASDPTCLPYFEGDYVTGEVENIITEIVAEEEAKNKNREDLPSLSTSNKGGNKKGTRSNPGELLNVGQDKVMLRLGIAMANMQQNFMVFHLHSRAVAATVEKGEVVIEDDNNVKPTKRMRLGGEVSGMNVPTQLGSEHASKMDPDGKLDTSYSHGNQAINVTEIHKAHDDDSHSLCSASVGGSFFKSKDVDEDPMNTFNESLTSCGEEAHHEPIHDLDPESLVHDKQANEGSEDPKKDSDKRCFDDIEPSRSSHVGDTSDPDDPQESEFAISPQQFLNYCQTNHFQFDDLRRAKHTTMMILYQLHHPKEPKLIPKYCTRRQQQLMDDRRRKAQNELYREGSSKG